jgi:hypothetical protein
MRQMLPVLVFATLAGLTISGAEAQQMTIGTPFNSASDSFYERMGVGFNNFQWHGGGVHRNGADNPMSPQFFFRQGSFNSAIPQFGGYDPSADATFGFNLRHKKWDADFNFAFGQGSRRSLVTQVPSVTIMNGQRGYVSDTSQSPFVIGLIPVVGDYPVVSAVNPLPQLPTYRYNPELIREINSRMQRAQRPYPAQDQGQVQPIQRQALQRLPIPDEGLGQGAQVAQARQAPVVVRPPSGQEKALVLTGGNPGPAAERGPAARLEAAGDSSAARPVPSVAEARRMFEVQRGDK